jgi:hypothetical protein
VQTLFTGFASDNGSFDSLLQDCGSIERLAKPMNPAPASTFSVNALNSETELNTRAILIQNSAVDDKLAKIEKWLAQMSLGDKKSKSVSDLTYVGRRTQNQNKNCYFCGKSGHIKRECFRFQASIKESLLQMTITTIKAITVKETTTAIKIIAIIGIEVKVLIDLDLVHQIPLLLEITVMIVLDHLDQIIIVHVIDLVVLITNNEILIIDRAIPEIGL